MSTETDFHYAQEIEKTLDAAIERMSLIDDIFFACCLRDNAPAAEEIIKVALDMPNVKVVEVIPQNEMKQINAHGVRFDLKVCDKQGRQFDVEVQKGHPSDLVRRSRYYVGMLSTAMLPPGAKDYNELKDAYVLFLCEKDPFGEGLPCYSYTYGNPDLPPRLSKLGDGSHIRFFNCAYKGKDAYGDLAKDILSADYQVIKNSVLRTTVESGKIGERRKTVMSETAQKLFNLGLEQGSKQGFEQGIEVGREQGIEVGREQGIEVGREQGRRTEKESLARALLSDGTLPASRIAALTGLSEEEVLALAHKA